MSALPAGLVSALQGALAAEHAAGYGYGLLGPWLDEDARGRAVDDSDAHEEVRDALEQVLAAAGVTPVTPLAFYPAFGRPTDPTAAARLAARLEQDAAAAWRFVYATAAAPSTADRSWRTQAQQRLTDAAVRAVRWRGGVDPAGASVPFPGL